VAWAVEPLELELGHQTKRLVDPNRRILYVSSYRLVPEGHTFWKFRWDCMSAWSRTQRSETYSCDHIDRILLDLVER
jgi:hypothetical protein